MYRVFTLSAGGREGGRAGGLEGGRFLSSHSISNSSFSSLSASGSEGSPRGPKGGGTLKTCVVCIEDYLCALNP